VSLLSQKTLKKSATFSGIGLHNGQLAKVCIKPAEPNSGIVFKRVDLKSNNYVYPSFTNVTNTLLNTTISNEFNVKVSTIEHLMGALFGLGIDNALVEINNDEVPILDGSAKEFIEILTNCGLEKSSEPIKIIKIQKKITYNHGKKFISIEPSKLSLDINFKLKFDDCLIGNQENKINVYEDDLEEIFTSRTFCLFDDVENIKEKGLAKGGSLDNAIVVKGNEILNSEKLRNPKEFVNHKILDCIGDLYTSGYRIIGSVNCSQGGHFLTNQLLKKVFENKENFSIIEIKERSLPHTILNKNLLRSIA
tara:strand:- start:788 stop:1708 length:921 start_codon:yes stop_codon:yes gene_type:complete